VPPIGIEEVALTRPRFFISGTHFALTVEQATMTNKLLLAAIAFGLWTNAAIWLVRPVQAQSDQLAGSVQEIAQELRQLVEHGEKCLNPVLCQPQRSRVRR
jgi:hypothetical protein